MDEEEIGQRILLVGSLITLVGMVAGPVILLGSADIFSFKDKDLIRFRENVVEKNRELGERISEQTGLYQFEPISIRFERNDDGVYEMRFFGDSQDLLYGARYSVMKNVVYTNLSQEQVKNYKEILKKVTNNAYNNSNNIRGEVLVTGIGKDNEGVGGIYSQGAYENYLEITNELFNVLNESLTNNFTIEEIAPVVSYTKMLSKEYEYDTSKPTLLQMISGQFLMGSIKTEYINTNYILTDVSPVNKEGENNYVYVDTIQTDDAKTFYKVQGCFIVDGENLTSTEVYKKIANGEYTTFFEGDKQTYKNDNIQENDLNLTM